MKTNPILEEVWRIKDQLAAEAGYDVDRFVDQLRAWTAAHPPAGPVVRTSEELRRLLKQRQKQHERTTEIAMRDKPRARR